MGRFIASRTKVDEMNPHAPQCQFNGSPNLSHPYLRTISHLSLSLSLMEESIPILFAKHKQRWHHYSRYKNHKINKRGNSFRRSLSYRIMETGEIKEDTRLRNLEYTDLQGKRIFFKCYILSQQSHVGLCLSLHTRRHSLTV